MHLQGPQRKGKDMENHSTDVRVVTTGELRGALQPVRFGVLAAPVLTTEGNLVFAEGDHVALQYWGNGITRVTVVDTHLSYPILSHSIRMYEPTSIQVDASGYRAEA
jgi:hypothetical protein